MSQLENCPCCRMVAEKSKHKANNGLPVYQCDNRKCKARFTIHNINKTVAEYRYSFVIWNKNQYQVIEE